MEKPWQGKKRKARIISNNEIDTIYERARATGAYASMWSGSGRGRFRMFLGDPPSPRNLIQTLEGKFGKVVYCHFGKTGTQGGNVL